MPPLLNIPFAAGTRMEVEQYHSAFAMDLRAREGAVVRAARAGRVVNAQDFGAIVDPRRMISWTDPAQRNRVYVVHDDATVGIYGHIGYHTVCVSVSDRVIAGEPLARVGAVGYANSPHVHFEIQGAPIRFARMPEEGSAVVSDNRPAVPAARIAFLRRLLVLGPVLFRCGVDLRRLVTSARRLRHPDARRADDLLRLTPNHQTPIRHRRARELARAILADIQGGAAAPLYRRLLDAPEDIAEVARARLVRLLREEGGALGIQLRPSTRRIIVEAAIAGPLKPGDEITGMRPEELIDRLMIAGPGARLRLTVNGRARTVVTGAWSRVLKPHLDRLWEQRSRPHEPELASLGWC